MWGLWTSLHAVLIAYVAFPGWIVMILARGPDGAGPPDVSRIPEEVAGGIRECGSTGAVATVVSRPSPQSCRLCAHHRATTTHEAVALTRGKTTRSALRDVADEASVGCIVLVLTSHQA